MFLMVQVAANGDEVVKLERELEVSTAHPTPTSSSRSTTPSTRSTTPSSQSTTPVEFRQPNFDESARPRIIGQGGFRFPRPEAPALTGNEQEDAQLNHKFEMERARGASFGWIRGVALVVYPFGGAFHSKIRYEDKGKLVIVFSNEPGAIGLANYVPGRVY